MLLMIFFLWLEEGYSLDNGLALTPPMGWMSWQRYRCTTDCNLFPDECISDKLIRNIATAMADEGYLAAGYEYIVIDDCWLEKERNASGYLQPDRKRFPYGMEDLSKFIHSKGLKFGIYENYGTKTCAGYPGIIDNVKQDINMFAEWEIDYIKVDGCYYNGFDYAKGYEEVKNRLNQTGRPVVFSCSYPAYQDELSIPTDFSVLAENCNLWRNFDDIDDSWQSVTTILDYFALKQDHIAKFAGPGHWNDPDMLLIGNYGLSYDQSKVQMALWAILAAPLLMSNDLTSIRHEHKEILLNHNIIKVNQDALGIQGLRVYRKNKIEVWTRKIMPVVAGEFSYAIAIYSRRADGMPFLFQVELRRLGLNDPEGYVLKDLYSDKTLDGLFFPSNNVTARVNPTGVVFLKATPQQ